MDPLKAIRFRILKSDFIRNVALLTSGTIFAQALSFGVSPILSRIYVAEDFAAFTIYTQIVGIFSILSTLSYSEAIVVPKEENKARKLSNLAFSLSVLVPLLLFLFLPIVEKLIIYFAKIENTKHLYIFLIPISVFLNANRNIINSLFTRTKNFKGNSKNRVFESILGSLANIGLGYNGLASLGLILGNIVAQFSFNGLSLLSLKRNIRILDFFQTKIDKLTLSEYKSFPLLNSPILLTDLFLITAMSFSLSNLFGTYTLGLFAFTLKIIQTPLTLVSTSIGQVFFKRIADEVNQNGEYGLFFRKVFSQLLILSIVSIFALKIMGPNLFAIIFGESWREAGVYAGLISPFLFANFIYKCFYYIPIVANKQKTYFILNTFYSFSLVLGLFVGHYFFQDITKTFHLISFLAVGISCLILTWFYRLSKTKVVHK
ncbi:oligosaccharide flippase family protein [Halobacteriovorax sp. GB3]|uniref:lipopolysaccharide biosynthesis protein n=1 Tax=Halobacteriovorax sp. GB3 TaxID=2719615 RepID=UPI00235ED11D|nr:oligosaccharide flippase family protein [Halobacteriovorax sp. GB3]MDD0852541.1 oligosaccharide flippase family protein [Halobacteriovorax sp. GB3]